MVIPPAARRDSFRAAIGAVAVLLLIGDMVASAPLYAARRRSVASPTRDSLQIATDSGGLSGDVEYVDLGVARPSADRSRIARVVRATRIVTLRVERESGRKGGTATLQAWLREVDPDVTIRINGMEIGLAARIIENRLPIGGRTSIRLQVDISADAPEGARFAALEWEATTNP